MESEIVVSSLHPLDKKKNTIVKANSLVRGRQRLSLQERRIIYMFISKIKPDDENFKVMRLNVRDIAKCLDIANNNYYTTVKGLILGLQKKGVYIKKKESILYVNWLASSEYYSDRGIIEVEFSSKMKPYLLQLKKEYYTKFKLENVISLNSIYSMQMYELLKQNAYRHTAKYSISDLKYMFDLKDDTYKRVSQFKARIIDQAQKEINKKTDIEFTYEDIKEGRSIVGFLFKIDNNKGYSEPTSIELNSPDNNDNYDVIVKLLDVGISKNMAKEIVSRFSDKRIIANLKYIKSKKKRYKNIAGSIITAIRQDYAMADEPNLFDKDLTDDQIVRGFVSDRLKFPENGMLPDYILKELFMKWVRKNVNVGEDRLKNIWDNNCNRIYSAINEKES